MQRDGLMKSVFAGNIDSTERFFQVQWEVAQKLPAFSVATDPGSALRVSWSPTRDLDRRQKTARVGFAMDDCVIS